MHPSRTPIRSLVDVVKWLERRQSFYIWHKGTRFWINAYPNDAARRKVLPDSKPKFMHHGWLQNMTIPTIRGLVASGAIYRALSDGSDRDFERDKNRPGSWASTEPKPARAPRPHWTARLKAR